MRRYHLSKLLRFTQHFKSQGKADAARNGSETIIVSPASEVRVSMNDLPVEIVQQILAHFDCLTLLKYRTVCSLWNACIPGDSPALREMMFFPTNTAPVATQWPPLNLRFNICTDGKYTTKWFRRAKNVDQVILQHVDVTTLLLHPIIVHVDEYLVAKIPAFDGLDVVDDLQFTHLRNKAGDLLRPDDISSLNDMLATAPPVKELHLDFRYLNHDFTPIKTRKNMRKCILFDKEGVRLVDLLDVIEKQVAGVLQRETLSRIDKMTECGAELKRAREKIASMACPIL